MAKKFFKFIIVLFIIFAVLAVGSLYALCRLFPLAYYDLIKEYSEKYSVDAALVCAVINTESHFSNNAKSHKGASGLMQIMEETADWCAYKMELEDYSYDNIADPETNINIGCWLLSRLLDEYGNETTALAAYNAGIGNVNKWLENPMYSGDRIHLNTIPFKETADYVHKVSVYKKGYETLLDLYENNDLLRKIYNKSAAVNGDDMT